MCRHGWLVGCEAGVTEDAGNRTDVDDPTVSMLDHVARHRLGNKEAATEIRIEDEVPVVPRHIERGFAHVAAGIIDEMCTWGESGDCGPSSWLRYWIVRVRRARGATARRPLASSSATKGRRSSLVAAGKYEIGTGRGEGKGDVLAETPAGSG